jgi:methionyl-tRNA formyltransferase
MSPVVVFAYSEVGYRCLKALLAAQAEVAWVVTHRDDPNESRWYRSVAELAASSGIAAAEYETLSATECLRIVRGIAPDFLFSFYFRKMLAPALLKTARRGALNMHGSLLPRYRGRAPINWAIVHGEARTGATLHYMTEKPDAGDVVDSQAVDVGVNDTALEVSIKVADAAEVVMRRSWPALLAGTAPRRPQDLASGSYFAGRKPADGRIDFARSAWDIHNLIRAVAPPFPGAFADVAGGRLELLGSRWSGERAQNVADAPRLYAESGNLYLDCIDDKRLHITHATLAGQALTAAALESRRQEFHLAAPVRPFGALA